MPSKEVLRAALGATFVAGLSSATQIAHPPCAYPYTPFEYVGCFEDTRGNRALGYSAGLDFGSVTVENCTAACKVEFKFSSKIISLISW